MKINKNVAFVSLLFTVVLISYANVFYNPFVWDDHTFIESNRKITSLENIPYFFTHESRNALWRPLRETFYALTYSVWGLNPFGYHLNALLLHALVTIFIFFNWILPVCKIQANFRKEILFFICFCVYSSHFVFGRSDYIRWNTFAV